MTERKTGGWLSSVVDNISGLWTRSSDQSDLAFDSSQRNISYEEQEEVDAGEENDGIIIESFTPGPSVPVPTTSTTQNDISSERRAVRYLSPSTLSAAARTSASSEIESLPNTTPSRKRAATSSLFEDDSLWPNVAGTSAKASMNEPLPGEFFTKRSRIQRNFIDEEQPLSHSLFRASSVEKSNFSQSFASSFTPLNAAIVRPNVLRPQRSASSSLSSKTRAILEQLEKISTPVKEIKRLSSFNENEPERWVSDALSSPVQKPPRNSMCALSRAQLISNILATKSTSPFWSRPAHSVPVTDSQTSRTEHSTEFGALAEEGRKPEKVSTKSSSPPISKKADLVDSSKTAKSEKAFANALPVKSILSKTAHTSNAPSRLGDMPQRSSTLKTTNVFSAKLPELEVVSPVKDKICEKEKEATPVKIDGSMFLFAPPMKRGPSLVTSCSESPVKISRSASTIKDDGAIKTSKTASQKTLASDNMLPKNSEDGVDSKNKTKDNQVVAEKSSTIKPLENTTLNSTLTAQLPSQKSAEKWSCSKCMVSNGADFSKCVQCGNEKRNVEAKQWTCSECWISNKANDVKCAACGVPKDGIQKLADNHQSDSAPNVFGDRAFKPVAVSKGVSFGFPATKCMTDGNVASATPTTAVASVDVQKSVVNGNVNSGPVTFGLKSSTSTPNFGLSKAPETAQPVMQPLSQNPVPALNFGVPSTSSATVAPFISSSTLPSLSFPTLTNAVTATTANSTGTTFSFPLSAAANPFTFGSSITTTAEATPATVAPLFTFGSSAASTTATTTSVAVTTAAPLPSFGIGFPTLPSFSVPKAPLFGSNGGSAASLGGQEVVEMGSPTTSPVTSVTAAPFGMAKSNTAPLFSFGATNTSNSSTSTGGIFGNLQTTAQNPITTPSQSIFSFGQQPPKPFEPPASLASPPSAFNFGGSVPNGGSGFVFGATTQPTNFAFGAQQSANSTAPTAFSFAPAVPSTPFGATPGSTPNFFSVGSTSSNTTTRKMLKARRTRK